MAKRNPMTLGQWGEGTVRVAAAEDYWDLPFKWDREAARAGVQDRVFSLSLADWLEDHCGPVHDVKGNRLYRYVDVNASAMDGSVGATLDDLRARMLDTIRRTGNLTYLLLTKRPQNWRPALEAAREAIAPDYRERDALRAWIDAWLAGDPPPNVWFGFTAENQRRWNERAPVALKVPAVVRFASLEPLVGPVRMTTECLIPATGDHPDMVGYMVGKDDGKSTLYREPAEALRESGLGWVIVGAESGGQRRPWDLGWLHSIRRECRAVGKDPGIPLYVKQGSAFRDGQQADIDDATWAIKGFPTPRIPAAVPS